MSSTLSNRQIARAALVALLGFLASGILGLLRTAIVSNVFGTGVALDAFLAAQRIPELIYVLVAGGALGSSFIPVFARYLSADDPATAWRLASATITLSSLAAGALSLLVVIFAPQIVPLILVPGKPAELQALTVSLTQIMMLTPFIFAISGLLMGLLQTHGNFLLPSLAISMNNIGLIIGALVIARLLPPLVDHPAQVGSANVYGLAWGAILSAVLHLGVQLPGLRRILTGPARLRPLLDWRAPGVVEVLAMMGPRVLGLGVAQLNFVVNANFASRMIDGSQSVLAIAWTLMFTVLGVIGQSVGTAVFPTLAALAASQDMTGYKEKLAGALRSVLFLAIPATVGVVLLGQPVIALVFQHGQWTAESTAGTAWALAFFGLGIAGHAALEVLARAFYALSDTRTPVLVGVISLIANIVLSAVFIQFIGDPSSLARGPFAGLALANSVTTLLEALVLAGLLRRRIGDLNDRALLDGIGRTLLAAGLMALALFGFTQLLVGQPPLLLSLGGLVIGAGVFFGAAYALGMSEVQTVIGALLRRIRR